MTARNHLFFELFGSGGAYSINYEQGAVGSDLQVVKFQASHA